MKPVKLAAGLSASPQLSLADVEEVRRLGYGSIIVNRPDGEEPGQPTIASMREAAAAAGLGFAAVPIAPGNASGDDVQRFGKALDELPGPVLAYCRTGTRAATLCALSQAETAETDELVSTAASAGYDLSMVRPAIDERAGRTPDGKRAK